MSRDRKDDSSFFYGLLAFVILGFMLSALEFQHVEIKAAVDNLCRDHYPVSIVETTS